MTQLQHDLLILQNAADLGFDQEDCINYHMNPLILDFADNHIKATVDKYMYLFEKMVQYAESWICDHQVESFVKEIYHDLTMKCAFGFQKSCGGWVEVDSGPPGLIDWDKYKDCKDDDKIFFYSALDSDYKTVLKFYDLGSKRHFI